jgi:hypothetical protein
MMQSSLFLHLFSKYIIQTYNFKSRFKGIKYKSEFEISDICSFWDICPLIICEHPVWVHTFKQINQRPRYYIYQYLGIFFLPETSACDTSKVFYLNSQRNKKFSVSFQLDQEKACNICPFQRFQYFQKA